MTFHTLTVFSALLLTLSGCAVQVTTVPAAMMVPENVSVEKGYLVNSGYVVAHPGNEIDINSDGQASSKPRTTVDGEANDIDVAARIAADEVLARSGMFGPDMRKPYRIDVSGAKLTYPGVAATVTSTYSARYRIAHPDGAVILDKDISANGVSPFSESLIGVIRVMYSVQRAFQNHFNALTEEVRRALQLNRSQGNK